MAVRVVLPCSANRQSRRKAFCTLVERVHNRPYLPVEGKIFPPAAIVSGEDLGPNPVVLEFAGHPEHRHGARLADVPALWLVWRYDWLQQKWQEVARTLATNTEWIDALRAPILQALYPKPELYDVRKRGVSVADELALTIEERPSREDSPVRINALAALYDRLAGQIVATGASYVSRKPAESARSLDGVAVAPAESRAL